MLYKAPHVFIVEKINGNSLKSSSLKFDKTFNSNRLLPVTYDVVEKSKGSMYVFYSLGLNWPCSTILKKEVF